jgi:hypothetical protein
MFAWIKTRRDGGNYHHEGARAKSGTRRFRPEGDRLESREVLSMIGGIGGTTAQFAPGLGLHTTSPLSPSTTTNVSPFGALGVSTSLAGRSTPGMAFSTPTNGFTGLTTNVSRFATLSGTNSALVGTTNTTPSSVFSTSASTAPLATLTRNTVTHGVTTRSVPREAGLQSNVNTSLANSGRLGGQFFPASSFPQSSVSGAVSGLAFTGGLGFSTPVSGTNGAQNGLAFTGGLGFSTPSFGTNGVQNGLSFTNGSGFSFPSTGFNATSNGLAFTNGSGFSSPSTGFNPATNGLSFTGGLGFTNPNTNPFLMI